MSGFTHYTGEDDFLAEFYDDPAEREEIKRGADLLVAENRGRRLVELRERARATREDVARHMGVALEEVAAIEGGFATVRDLAAYMSAIGGELDLVLVAADGSLHVVEANRWPRVDVADRASLLQRLLADSPASNVILLSAEDDARLDDHSRYVDVQVVAELDGLRTTVA
ncbi:hypothetical protein [Kitasatospora sp. GAS204B]|uniref:helix-turn-helix domain-containing protein n=1 Tax=unclassified Kitasatospora TaxID=2633591 RepID=UPI002475A093|nr:hypothetical protein [Kitasatospora sp. GAS204B]MDH6118273.1 transcriptional regulator with XRE-family HTH domain [Kitasatospora sp. GAS204B]